jgi:amino acid transporter
MSPTFTAAVAGAVLGLVLGGLGAGFFALTPIPAAHPKTSLVIAELATVTFTILGAAGGVAYVRLTTRRPTTGPEIDYDDPSTHS